MRLFVFTDIHGHKEFLANLKEQAQHADLLVCTGDFTQFEHNIERVLDAINALGKQCIIITGNHEDEESVQELCKTRKYLIFLHGTHFVKDGVFFFGYGGGGFAMMDKEFLDIADVQFKKAKEGKKVLLVHGPPYKTACDKLSMGYVGNKSYRDIIVKYQPDYVFCGHLHENFGKEDTIGKSIIVNPGPMGMFFDI